VTNLKVRKAFDDLSPVRLIYFPTRIFKRWIIDFGQHICTGDARMLEDRN